MAVSVKNEKVTITNAAGDQLECTNGVREIILRVRGCTFQISLGEAQTLSDWMQAKVDEDVSA